MPLLSLAIPQLLIFVGLFFSLWIVIPAPIFALLPLSVGAPEISPGLLLLNLLSFSLSLLLFKFHPLRLTHPQWLILPLALSTLALIISSWPLSQFATIQQQADRELAQTVGPNYETKIPATLLAQMRSQPFSLLDCFRGIPERPIRTTEGIPFANPDNTPLTLNLYRPATIGHYPAIVTIYGGAWQRGNPSQDAAFNRYIAAQGYTVWAISYRHAPQYTFPTQLEDTQSALQFIQQHAAEYETDLDRVAVMGRSAGSQLASLLAYKYSPIAIRAMVNYYGPVNLTKGYYNIPDPDPIDSRSTLRAFLGGTPAECPDRYHQASPINTVTEGLPPSLLIYGGKDNIVQSIYGEKLADALRAKHNAVSFIQIPWADHAFDAVFRGFSNQLALYYTERFLGGILYGD